MTIDALPTPPTRSDPTNFSTRADAFMTALPTFATQANATASDVNDAKNDAEAAATAAGVSATAAADSATAADAARLIAEGAANFQGEYSGAVTYTVGQSVSYSGNRYVAKKTNLDITPTNGADWLLLATGGTVTSVAVSGGSTGLTTSGGPITGEGTITFAGTLARGYGGTGQTTYTNGQLLIGNSSNGLSKATITAGTGISVTNGSGSITIAVDGSTYQPIDSDLTAIAALSANGMMTRTGTGTAAVRTITASTGISVTNGDGVSGNPTIAVDAATDANFQAATANKVLTSGILNTANAPEESTSGSAWTPDFDSARVFTRLLTGSQAINNPSNVRAGQSGLIFISQTGTSGYTISSWGSNFKWPAGGAPVLVTTQNKVNVIGYYCKSATEIVCIYSGSY